MAYMKRRCLRTESRTQTSYPSEIERSVLQPAGVELIAVDMDEPGAFEALAPTADAVLHMRGVIDAPRVRALAKCKIIAHYGTGVDRLDVATATEMGMYVTNGAVYAVDEVSTHAIALMLGVARKIVIDDRAVREGKWHIPPVIPLRRISGRTFGLLGFGNIARATAKKAAAFGLNLIAYDPYLKPEVFEAAGARPVDFQTCLRESDIVSIHLPLTPETKGIINKEALALMKPDAILVNTSRGPVVDQAALADALRAGHLAGAGLDVFEREPLPTDDPILDLPNVIVTGHIGFYSIESNKQMLRDAAEQVRLALTGETPQYLVNRAQLKPR
ncbi:MAG: C-terminal binding protein [Armatimonadetes bacterium]|nr:C-terminal binding protein [Armatimonadota bacterium]